MRLTDLAIRSLEDKSSQVRKNCIALLTKLILTHPYGMHGGELCLSEWQARYKALEDELKLLDLPGLEEAEAMREARELMEDAEEDAGEEAEEGEKEGEGEGKKEDEEDEGADSDASSNPNSTPKKKQGPPKDKGKKRAPRPSAIDLAAADQSQLLAQVDQDTLTRLRLTKKYYADAIAFIEQLTRGMDTVEDLLASTVKGEVLEAMEFFKVASQYKIEQAHVRRRPSSPRSHSS